MSITHHVILWPGGQDKMFEKTIDFLLGNACVSIQYLVHRDMMKVPINDPLMKKMQAEVMQQPAVQKRLESQHPDGWLGHELHGGDGMDSLIGVLLGLGVEPDSLYIKKAINALTTLEIAQQHKNHFAAGEALDADGRGVTDRLLPGFYQQCVFRKKNNR